MSATANRSRQVLCITEKASAKSLPASLRHLSPVDALEEARALTVFLRGVCAEDVILDGGNEGLVLVLGLLQDKLEIGMGRYHFPFLSHDDDASALVGRGE